MKYKPTGKNLGDAPPLGMEGMVVDEFTLAHITRDYYLIECEREAKRAREGFRRNRGHLIYAGIVVIMVALILWLNDGGAGLPTHASPIFLRIMMWMTGVVAGLLALAGMIGLPMQFYAYHKARVAMRHLATIEVGTAARAPAIQAMMQNFIERGAVVAVH